MICYLCMPKLFRARPCRSQLISLSDSDAMMPQMSISKFDSIIVGARVSKTGNPVGQPGDLFDESDAIQHKSFQGQVEINIDQVKQ